MTGERRHGVRSAVLRALPPATAAALLWWWGLGIGAAAAAAAAVLLLVAGLTRPTLAERLDALVGRAASTTASLVGSAITALGWTLFVIPSWALSRVSGYDPLQPGGAGPTAWSDSGGSRAATRPDRIGTAEPPPDETSRRRRRTRRVVAAGAVVILAGAAGAAGAVELPFVGDREPWMRFGGLPVEEWSFPDEPWARELLEVNDTGWVRVPGRIGWLPRDGTSRWINVEDHARRTLTVADPEVTVFLFGGSSTFGVGQRDEHTIASELVRQAAGRGLRLRVVNRGVSAHVNWQETAFLTSLVEDGDVPDVAVFLDGGNESVLAWDRLEHGYPDPGERMVLSISDRERAERAAHARRTRWRRPADPRPLWEELVASQYRDGVLEARELADRHGFRTVHFWQPQLMTVPLDRPRVADTLANLGIEPADRDRQVESLDRARRRSGVDPIDLTGIFDDVDRPVFFDGIHSNEAGARLIATAMLDHLWPVLTSVRAQR